MRIGLKILLGICAVLLLAIGGVAAFILTLDVNRYKGEIESLAAEQTGRKLTLRGELSWKLFPRPAIAVKDVVLANAPWGSRPDMASLGELVAEVEVMPLLRGGDLMITLVALKDVDLLLETDGRGKPNWAFEAKPGAAGQAAPASGKPAGSNPEAGAVRLPQLEEVRLVNVRVTYKDGPADPGTVVDLASFQAKETKSQRIALKGDIRFREESVALEGVIGALPLLFDTRAPYPVDLTVAAGGATLKATGTVAGLSAAPKLDLRIEAVAEDPSKLDRLAGATLPKGKAIRVAAAVAGEPDREIRFSALELAFGQSRLSGEALLRTAGPRPRLEAKLAGSMIDTNDFAAPAAETRTAPPAQRTPAQAGARRLFPGDPLPLAALGALDANVELAVDMLKAAGLEIGNLRATAALEDRNLDLKPVSLTLFDGAFAGTLSLAARSGAPALAVDLVGKGVDVGKLARSFGQDMVEAKGDLLVQLKGAGPSVAAIMAALDGRTEVVVGSGRIKSRWVDVLSTSIVQVAMPWTLAQSETRLNCMVSRFDVRRGVATSRALLADAERMSVTGGGTINLGTEQIAMQLLPKPKDPGALSPQVPIEIKGWLGEPSIGTGPAGVVQGVVGLATGLGLAPFQIAGQGLGITSQDPAQQNPCVAAVSGRAPAQAPAAQQQQPAQQPQQGGIGGAIQGIGRGIQGIFGGSSR